MGNLYGLYLALTMINGNQAPWGSGHRLICKLDTQNWKYGIDVDTFWNHRKIKPKQH